MFRPFRTSCFQALIQSRVLENSIVALLAVGSYVHNYKFKICVHTCLQNNGMELFVVNILPAGVRQEMHSDVFCIYTSNAIWKILANIEFSPNFFKYFFCWRRHMLCL